MIKRCPNGTRRNKKTGLCEQNISSKKFNDFVEEVQENVEKKLKQDPLISKSKSISKSIRKSKSISKSISKSSSKAKTKRCPKGQRRNKKTGLCENK